MYLDVKINNVPVQLEVKTVGPASLADIDEFREKLTSGDLVLIDQSDLVDGSEEKDDKINPYFIKDNNKHVVPEENGNEQCGGDINHGIDNLHLGEGGELANGGLVTVPTENVVEPQLQQVQDEPTRESDPSQNEQLEPVKSESQEQEKQNKPDILDVVEDIQEIFENNKDPDVTKGVKPWWKSKTIISNIFAAAGCLFGVIVSDDPQSSMYLPASIVAFINLYLRSITKIEVKLPMEEKVRHFRRKK
jgi:hypothetical protein